MCISITYTPLPTVPESPASLAVQRAGGGTDVEVTDRCGVPGTWVAEGAGGVWLGMKLAAEDAPAATCTLSECRIVTELCNAPYTRCFTVVM